MQEVIMVEYNPKAAILNSDFKKTKNQLPYVRRLIKGGGWLKLSSAIRSRFDALAEAKHIHQYSGEIIVNRSKLGFLFSCICKLCGSSLLAQRTGKGKVDLSVFRQGGGVRWQRIYHDFKKTPSIVSGVKIIDEKMGLIEQFGWFLCAKLELYEEGGNLHIKSQFYYIKLGRFFLLLPLFFTPGVLHIAHIDNGSDSFTFRMVFNHKYFGQIFHQYGVFYKTGEK